MILEFIPRRGGAPGPALAVAPDAAERLARALPDDGDGAAALRLYGEPDGWRTLVDGLVARRGPAAAAASVAGLAGRTDPARPGSTNGLRHKDLDALSRLRAFLAATGDDEYARAIDLLAPLRGSELGDLVTGFLVPTRHDWAAADLARRSMWTQHNPLRVLALCSLGAPEHLDGVSLEQDDLLDRVILGTLADGVGGDALAAHFARLLDGPIWDDAGRALGLALGRIPGDRALLALAERAGRSYMRTPVLAALRRVPERLPEFAAALRSGGGSAILDLLQRERALLDVPRVPDAAPADVPGFLATPPGQEPRPEPVVVPRLKAPAPVAAWAEGERAGWLNAPVGRSVGSMVAKSTGRPYDAASDSTDALRATEVTPEWRRQVDDVRRGSHSYAVQDDAAVLLLAPDELVRPVLKEWNRHPHPWRYYGDFGPTYKVLAARFEADALPFLLPMARWDAGALVPFLDVRVAAAMAARGPDDATAAAWLRRHGLAAVPYLLKDALAKPGPKRRKADALLRALAAEHGADEVAEAAGEHREAVAASFAFDSSLLTERKMPVLGPWLHPEALPQAVLRATGTALPAALVPHLVTLIALDDGRVERIREVFEPASLTRLTWALFGQWQSGGEPSPGSWALLALGAFGDDETARLLTPSVHAWPGDNGHAKAVKGLDVLARIGTDTALGQLNTVAQRAKFKAIKQRAAEKMEDVAHGLGLTGEELADRLVPAYGLDDRTLDYGPRRFTIGVDEQLKPYVVDEAGKVRKALPKPGAKDDPEKAPAAHRRFADLKKDLRATAAIQIQRMELAMTTGRRWSAPDFDRFIARHPLTGHLARRLVWLAEDDGTATAFRIAEDGTLADVRDDPFALPDDARVAVAHPLHLGADLAAWSELLADYEILQPFEQLARPVRALTGEQRAARRLAAFENVTVPTGRVLALVKRGWKRAAPQDNGTEFGVHRDLPGGLHLMVALSPGITVGNVMMDPDQTLTEVWITDAYDEYHWFRDGPHTFGDLDAVTASEILLDLNGLADAAS
ncbi:DUF4132 domain-containing protein [Actinomadura parmotrematis]|uniref:DUF4132 domain-containing protein n=1 Tax=Actinomadura parmotrematis TaxID=2864039 RepID=A0ABS7G1G9_9ACTN|nr:DUF4132 domain-containing protein [Actinomadura parmotrematis]MBW8485682.1 DUF4132 domain-containing protein [Actinomadura parmotrematis]